jgi:hypothetical protein
MWAGSIVRPSTIVLVIGAMSNKLNQSLFHDIFLPVSQAYNQPEIDLDFLEAALEGSARLFLNTSLADNLFVAQWGRSCIYPPQGGAWASPPCIAMTEDILSSNSSFFFETRHYLDPQTGSGPSRDALPRHRVMVFDAVSGA